MAFSEYKNLMEKRQRIGVENAAVKLILGRCAIYHALDIGIPKIRFYEFCV